MISLGLKIRKYDISEYKSEIEKAPGRKMVIVSSFLKTVTIDTLQYLNFSMEKPRDLHTQLTQLPL